MSSIPYLTLESAPREGDQVVPLMAMNQHDEECILWGYAGQPIVFFCFTSVHEPVFDRMLQEFVLLAPEFDKLDAVIIGLSLDTHEVMKAYAHTHSVPFHLLSKDTLQVDGNIDFLKEYGIIQASQPGSNSVVFAPTTFLIDRNSRIKKSYPSMQSATHANQVLEDMKAFCGKGETRVVMAQAPVLLIDNVLTPQECRYLMQVWQTQGNRDSGAMRTIDGKTVGVYDYDTKIRRDHFINDRALLVHLDLTLRRRIFPHIQKAFNFDCTRREDYKIACYDAERGGYFRKHRDNTTAATAHRLWAMSLNLNAGEYEGGYLRFPEYGDCLYQPPTGSALIFSGKMMHEATDVHKGKRFVLLTFFYGEKEAEIRARNKHMLQEMA